MNAPLYSLLFIISLYTCNAYSIRINDDSPVKTDVHVYINSYDESNIKYSRDGVPISQEILSRADSDKNYSYYVHLEQHIMQSLFRPETKEALKTVYNAYETRTYHIHKPLTEEEQSAVQTSYDEKMKRFKEKPNYEAADEQALLDLHVLVRADDGTIMHGPLGLGKLTTLKTLHTILTPTLTLLVNTYKHDKQIAQKELKQ